MNLAASMRSSSISKSAFDQLAVAITRAKLAPGAAVSEANLATRQELTAESVGAGRGTLLRRCERGLAAGGAALWP
jgi:hypothetical protein